MIVRMAHWNCLPEYWGDECDLFETAAVPMLRQQDGFVRAMLLGAPGESARIAVTVWRDGAAYQQFTKSPDLARIIGMFAHMYVDGTPPRPEEFLLRAEGVAEQT